MAPETPLLPQGRPGLPPVEPPSGRLLGQLFLVPGLIVAGVVVLLLFFNWLVSGPRSVESFLHKLDDPNPEVRWRAAADLSQVLLRDDRLASDPAFALALASRLDRARGEAAGPEEALLAKWSRLSPQQMYQEQAKREQDRNYVNFLAACLGNFVVPVGAPVLQELATTEKGLEPKSLAGRRRAALWALANLGENLKRFDKLSSVQQEALIAGLNDPKGDRLQTTWAQAARAHLVARKQGVADAMGMDQTIASCAGAEDPYLRELAAFAANFWHGDLAAEQRIEQALVRLAHDDGRGEGLLEEWSRDEPAKEGAADYRPVTKLPGAKVRMNAAIALARRGSALTQPEVLAEMLDEPHLQSVFVLRSRSGPEQPDTTFLLNTIVSTLRAVVELHHLRPQLAMPAVQSATARLTNHTNPVVQSEARETQLALQQ